MNRLIFSKNILRYGIVQSVSVVAETLSHLPPRSARVLITLEAGEGSDLRDGDGKDFSVFVNYVQPQNLSLNVK